MGLNVRDQVTHSSKNISALVLSVCVLGVVLRSTPL